MIRLPRRAGLGSQRGVVLVTALVFLVLLTILGLSASGTASLEVLMSRNFRDRDVAFAAAEAALRDAEIRINGYYANPATPVDPFAFNATCNNGLCDATVAQPVHALDFFGGVEPAGNSVPIGTVTGSPEVPNVAAQPRYLIEAVCRSVPGESATGASCQNIYRITVQAQGRLGTTRVVLESTYVP